MKARAGIVGAAGYTGGELVRLLLNHPEVALVFAQSRSQAGKLLSSVHKDLIGDTDLSFSADIDATVDIIFLALPHGEAKTFVETNTFDAHTKVIDLSNDFRLKANAGAFVYGLPELQRAAIQKAQFIANPGCFATAIQLALLPLANAGLLFSDVHISAITGSTGAGVGLSATSHFTWRQNNLSVYKAFDHQHLGEIGETISGLQNSFSSDIHFIPYRGDFTRGIIATLYTPFEGTQDAATALFESFYENHPFTWVSHENIDLKQVVNTNKCIVYPMVKNGQLMIISIIDNLLKGASGQAVQNMNLMMGWNETSGLQLKASVY
jgi:N-acetyl-gamma-glutamyl-phosphate reductase